MKALKIGFIGVRVLAGLISFSSHASIAQPVSSPGPLVSTSIQKIHQFAFDVHQGKVAKNRVCTAAAQIFDYAKWLHLPVAPSPEQACSQPVVSQMLEEIVILLVDTPQQLILEKAGELLNINDFALKALKGEKYVTLKRYLEGMLKKPLDFSLAGPVFPLDCGAGAKESSCDRFQVPVQLASGLVRTLDELAIEPQAAQAVKIYGRANYVFKSSQDGQQVLLEQVQFPQATLKIARKGK